jgi:alkylation response protein AidB-like acyl-CoA dehydrogenase
MKLMPSAMADEGAAGLGALLRGSTRNLDLAHGYFDADFEPLWHELTSGEWHLLGACEKHGGAEFDLMDLTAVAAEWGRYLIPLPFIPTMLLWRWGMVPAQASAHEMLSYGLATKRAGDDAGVVVPYGSCPRVQVLNGSVTVDGMPSAADAAAAWAPSMPVAYGRAGASDLPPEAAAEIAVLGAAELLGIGAVALRRATSYARERSQFGRVIAEYQGVQHRLADMQLALEEARTAVVWGANEMARVPAATRIAWDAVRRVTEGATQIHGGFGFTWEAGLHFLSRHVSAWGEIFTACGTELWVS